MRLGIPKAVGVEYLYESWTVRANLACYRFRYFSYDSLNLYYISLYYSICSIDFFVSRMI